MSTREEVQLLMRFLSQDAKVPMVKALGYIKQLQVANMTTVKQIADSKLDALSKITEDDKVAKQIHNAAKRHFSKKRTATDVNSSTIKKVKRDVFEVPNPESLEKSLALPPFINDEEVLNETVIFCNRAPLVLAFATVLLKYTMPEQPLSSRLSLAQAVVSLNSRSKAVSLGLQKGVAAEEEGFGEGFGVVKVMGRDVRTLRRVGWEVETEVESKTQKSTQTVQGDGGDVVAYWGIDLEALRTSERKDGGRRIGEMGDLPIHTPQSARAYLGKSFEFKGSDEVMRDKSKTTAADKDNALGRVLGSLDLLFASWAGSMGAEDMDSKAWSWYVRVRPSVPDGVGGWGVKGELKLKDILALRKKD